MSDEEYQVFMRDFRNRQVELIERLKKSAEVQEVYRIWFECCFSILELQDALAVSKELSERGVVLSPSEVSAHYIDRTTRIKARREAVQTQQALPQLAEGFVMRRSIDDAPRDAWEGLPPGWQWYQCWDGETAHTHWEARRRAIGDGQDKEQPDPDKTMVNAMNQANAVFRHELGKGKNWEDAKYSAFVQRRSEWIDLVP